MQHKTIWNGCAVYLHEGDITTLTVDAIVNAANSRLAGGGGVDGAIHRAGGPKLMEECQRIMSARKASLPAGEAVITSGGKLPARHVIHAVGPVYDRHKPAEAAELLAACYRNSLLLLRQVGGRSIALPCISTGVYGYPQHEACPVALQAVRAEMQQHGACDKVVFCTFANADFRIYEDAFAGV